MPDKSHVPNIMNTALRYTHEVEQLKHEVRELQKQREDLGRFLEVDKEKAELEKTKASAEQILKEAELEKRTILDKVQAMAKGIIEKAEATSDKENKKLENFRMQLINRKNDLDIFGEALLKREDGIIKKASELASAIKNFNQREDKFKAQLEAIIESLKGYL